MVNYTCMQNVKLMVGEGCHTQMGEALKEAGYRVIDAEDVRKE